MTTIRDDCCEFLEFVDECSFDGGIDIFERIHDALWNDGKVEGVTAGKTAGFHPETPGGIYSGDIDIGDYNFYFKLESSNNRGDVMLDWGLNE